MVEALEIKKESEDKLLDIPGVAGVGLASSNPKITVYVEKLTPEMVKEIPTEIKGVPVVVIETGKFEALQARTDKWRPAPGGVSIGHYAITAGTLGIRVVDNVSGRRVILSNNHVLANRDSIQNSRANKGDAIYQPGPYDGGSSADKIAELERWVKIDEEGTNTVDCAITMPDDDADLSDEILEIGVVNEMIDAAEGMDVQKSGRTTELNTGTVLDVNMTVDVGYGLFTARFTDQIMTTNMAAGGDSGSALCTMDNKIVGLLFAGSSSNTIHCKIGNVVSALNIDIAPTPPPPVGILPLLLGGAALMAVPMIIGKKERKEEPKLPEEKMPLTKILIGGGLVAGGIILYYYLKPVPPPPGKAKINVNSIPSGATVYLNENHIGTTPIKDYEVDPGTYVLQLFLEGYHEYEKIFSISEGEIKTFNITLRPLEEEVSAKINEFTITA